jgi:hypothetical protein
MGDHVQQLARLRTATATGVLPRDLGLWALDLLDELEPAAERVERRNVLLRAAAARVSGSTWARARRLEREIRDLTASPRLRSRAADDGVRELVVRAIEADPDLPRSHRHLRRILEGTHEVDLSL